MWEIGSRESNRGGVLSGSGRGSGTGLRCHGSPISGLGFDLKIGSHDAGAWRARRRGDRPTRLLDRVVYPRRRVDRSVYHSGVHRTVGLPGRGSSCRRASSRHTPDGGCKTPCRRRRLAHMTTTDATTADLALAELHEHIAAIERLAHQPFNRERIALHRANALECLDAIAGVLA